MRNIILCSLFLAVSFAAKAQLVDEGNSSTAMMYEKGLRFCEGTVPYRNLILVSNFGTNTLNPLNNEGKGYIMALDEEDVRKIFITTDGNLSAPKGMTIVGNHLFIADVAKVVVYDLKNTMHRPQIIRFAAEDTFVNDLVHLGDMVIVSVTNTGRVYGIDATDLQRLDGQTPKLLGDIPGANGMVANDYMIYVSSYNPNGVSTNENVIYGIDITAKDKSLKKLIPELKPGQYDGIALSPDGETLYFTSWGDGTKGSKPAVYSYKLDGKSGVKQIDFGVDFQGPADISIKGDYIWIPDLPSSKVYRFPL